MSYELDGDAIAEFILDNLPPSVVRELKEKDYWKRAIKVMEDSLRDPAPKTDICPLCQKSGHDV